MGRDALAGCVLVDDELIRLLGKNRSRTKCFQERSGPFWKLAEIHRAVNRAGSIVVSVAIVLNATQQVRSPLSIVHVLQQCIRFRNSDELLEERKTFGMIHGQNIAVTRMEEVLRPL